MLQKGDTLLKENPQLSRAAESVSIPVKIEEKQKSLADILMTDLKNQAIDKGEAKLLIGFLLRLGFIEQVRSPTQATTPSLLLS